MTSRNSVGVPIVLPRIESCFQKTSRSSVTPRDGALVAVQSVRQLQRQARQRIDLHVRGRASAAAYHGLKGVVEASARRSVVHLVVKGDIGQVLDQANRDGVRRIVTHQTDLEDIFLAYYRGEA